LTLTEDSNSKGSRTDLWVSVCPTVNVKSLSVPFKSTIIPSGIVESDCGVHTIAEPLKLRTSPLFAPVDDILAVVTALLAKSIVCISPSLISLLCMVLSAIFPVVTAFDDIFGPVTEFDVISSLSILFSTFKLLYDIAALGEISLFTMLFDKLSLLYAIPALEDISLFTILLDKFILLYAIPAPDEISLFTMLLDKLILLYAIPAPDEISPFTMLLDKFILLYAIPALGEIWLLCTTPFAILGLG
jgi:hypothetical protein